MGCVAHTVTRLQARSSVSDSDRGRKQIDGTGDYARGQGTASYTQSCAVEHTGRPQKKQKLHMLASPLLSLL